MHPDSKLPSVDAPDSAQLRWLRFVGRAEGATLLLLIGVAVPVKRLLGEPMLVSVIGPIHGLTFVAYIVAVVSTVSGGGWNQPETIRTLLVAVIPFGTFWNERLISQKLTAPAP